MSRWRGLLIALLVLAAVAGAGAWWWHTYERVEEVIDLPRTGEARTNPLYALKLALGKDGVKATARRRLELDANRLASRDTVLVYNDPRTLSDADTNALLQWVYDGGHLIVRTPPADGMSRGERIPILDALGVVAMAGRGARCVPLRVHGEDDHVEFCGARRFIVSGLDDEEPEVPDVLWRSDSGYVQARFPRGQGWVDVVADLDFLSSDKLKDGPHIALTRQLLAPNYRAGTVHLIYAAQMPSLWWTLARHSWMAWLPLALALLAWLWARMQRFGPMLPAPDGARRSLLEHIVASGEHSYRYGYAHLLHRAVRENFLRRLRRIDPQAAALDGEPQVSAIAERFGPAANLAPSDIRNALAMTPANDAGAFRARVATLIRMNNLLREPRP